MRRGDLEAATPTDKGAATRVMPAASGARPDRGRPLDASTAGRMGAALGHSFADVRIHDDPASGEQVRGARAIATTVGSDISFAPGAYRPGTLAGDALLAHELAHVQQQRDADGPGAATASADGRALEDDADQATVAALAHLHGVAERGGARGATRRAPRIAQRCDGAPSWAPAMPAGTTAVPATTNPAMLTGARVDEMLARSPTVGRYLGRRINPTGACAGSPTRAADATRFHETDSEFRNAQVNYYSRVRHPQHLGTCGRNYTETEARAEPLLDGFAINGSIHIRGGADPAITMHEAVHLFQSAAFVDELGQDAKEGTTDYLAGVVLREQAAGTAPTHSILYPQQHEAIRRMVVVGGVGVGPLCDAFFDGNLDSLRTAMNRNHPGRYESWRSYMRQVPPDYASANALF